MRFSLKIAWHVLLQVGASRVSGCELLCEAVEEAYPKWREMPHQLWMAQLLASVVTWGGWGMFGGELSRLCSYFHWLSSTRCRFLCSPSASYRGNLTKANAKILYAGEKSFPSRSVASELLSVFKMIRL